MKAAFWKESASLIILAKTKNIKNNFNYNVLMFNRTEKTSFMPNHVVFPGGVMETSDESRLWLKYFKKFGVNDQLLKDLTVATGVRPDIYKQSKKNSIEREIALRITAIRETFEEVGLFLCRGKNDMNEMSGYGSYIENFNRKHWQHEVHNDPTKFLEMCQELNVIPDLWSLWEWSTWLTPASFNKRFETAFYLVALNNQPNLLCEENEVADYLWKNPIELYNANRNSEIWLPPPQCYELSRLANISELEDVKNFANDRSLKGSELFLPVQRRCNNGLIGLLPGDDEYPKNPNECIDIVQVDESVEDNCSKVNRCHRTIYTGVNECKVILNFKPSNGHLAPLDLSVLNSKL